MSSVPEIAAATLAELRQNGWGKGDMAIVDYDSLPDHLWEDYDATSTLPYEEYGEFGMPSPEGFAVCKKCLAGAAGQAVFGDPTKADWVSGYTPDYVHFLEALAAKIGPDPLAGSGVDSHPHAGLVRHVTSWNDAEDRVFADVERVLTELAAA